MSEPLVNENTGKTLEYIVVECLNDVLPNSLDRHAYVRAYNLPPPAQRPYSGKHYLAVEIAERLVAIAKLVPREGFRDQALLVFADYHDHVWAGGKLKTMVTYLTVIDQILRLFDKETSGE